MSVYFCLGIILKVFQYNFQNNAQTKIVQIDLNSPRRELSNDGLESVATLLIRWQLNYLFASSGKAIQLYIVRAYKFKGIFQKLIVRTM